MQASDNMLVEENDEELAQHQQGVAMLLNSDRLGEKLACDLTLTSEGREFQVNKCVMMLTCEYFKKMFTVEMKEKSMNHIFMENIPADRLSDIIDFIYTGKIKITEENVINFLDDAEYLQLKNFGKHLKRFSQICFESYENKLALKTHCTNFVLKVLSADNCIKLRAYAKKYHCDAVVEKVNLTVKSNFKHVVNGNDFMQLDVEEVYTILKLRGKHDEEHAFKGILKWVEHDVNQRKEMFSSLFSLLDLSARNSDFLTSMAKEVMLRENLSFLSLFVDDIFKSRATDGDKCLIAGGEYTKNECTVYNVITRKPRQLPNLNLDRVGATAVNVRGRVYVIGGANFRAGGTVYRSCEILDIIQPTAWSAIPDMLDSRKFCGSGHINGFVYVTGGLDKEVLKSCEKFDLANDVWLPVSNMQQARGLHGVSVYKGSLYCIGGYSGGKSTNCCERLNVGEGKWIGIASLNEARHSLACVELGGMIYAIGGSNGKSTLSTVEKYNPGSDEWKAAASLQTRRQSAGACVLGGKIFVVGGFDGTRYLQSVEVYDPISDTWTHSFDVEQSIFGACVVAV